MGNVAGWRKYLDYNSGDTADTYTYTNIPSTALFTVLVGNANCTPVYSGIARVTVIPEFTPVITATGGDICAGEPVTLTGTVAVLPDTFGAIQGGLFNQANPKGWQVYEDGLPLFPFPASMITKNRAHGLKPTDQKHFVMNCMIREKRNFQLFMVTV